MGVVSTSLSLVNRIYQEGQDLVALSRSFLGHLRDLVVARFTKTPETLIPGSVEDVAQLVRSWMQAKS